MKAREYYAWSWSKALNHAFGREEEGNVLGDIGARLTRNLCECILFFYGEICGIAENVPRFLKNAFHIPEERYLGLASLYLYTLYLYYDEASWSGSTLLSTQWIYIDYEIIPLDWL